MFSDNFILGICLRKVRCGEVLLDSQLSIEQRFGIYPLSRVIYDDNSVAHTTFSFG